MLLTPRKSTTTPPTGDIIRKRLWLLGVQLLCILTISAGFQPAALAQTKQAPAFDLESMDGARFSSKALEGKVVLVDFWATWCAPCIAEIPHWNELCGKYRDKGFVVLGVTIRSGWASDIKPDVKRLKITYPVVVGDDNLEQGFGGIWGFPTTFLVNRKGQIYKKYTGTYPQKQEQIDTDIQKLLVEKPLEAAK